MVHICPFEKLLKLEGREQFLLQWQKGGYVITVLALYAYLPPFRRRVLVLFSLYTVLKRFICFAANARY